MSYFLLLGNYIYYWNFKIIDWTYFQHSGLWNNSEYWVNFRNFGLSTTWNLFLERLFNQQPKIID